MYRFPKNVLIYLCVFYSLTVFSQKPTKNPPISNFSTPEEAKSHFDKTVSSKKSEQALTAQFGLAQYWRLKDSFTVAYDFAQKAAAQFADLKDKQKSELQKNGISLAKVKTLMDTLSADAYKAALRKNTLNAWSAFIKQFPKPVVRTSLSKNWDTATVRLNAFLCNRLKDETNADSIMAFIQRNEKDLKRLNNDCLMDLYAHHFSLNFKKQNWDDVDDYFKKNPKSPLAKDPQRKDFLIAVKSKSGRTQQAFAEQAQGSLFVNIIMDSILEKSITPLILRGTPQDWTKLIRKYPKFKKWSELDPTIADYLGKTQDLTHFIDNRNNRLNLQYLPKTEQKLYEIYRQYGEVWSLKQFLNDFEGLSMSQTVEAEIRFLESASDKDILEKAAYTFKAFKILQDKIQPDIKAKKWDAALSIAKSYEQYFSKDDKRFSNLIEILERPYDDNVTVNKLTSNVNSLNDEYAPVVSPDNQSLYFCRRNNSEDVFISSLDSKGKWGVAVGAKGLVSSTTNEAPIALSPDGNQMLMFIAGKLHISEKNTEGVWGSSIMLSENINAADWQGAASFSPDGNVIIFESKNRSNMVGVSRTSLFDDTFENIDLFISFRKRDSMWTSALNIGTTINTAFKERSPFIHPDNNTLYFSSSGKGGLGGMDFYKTTRLDSTWLHWSEPIHIGKELNTAFDDWGYSISTTGRLAYFSTNGDLAVVTPLPKAAAPLETNFIRGRLVDLSGKPVVDAYILIRDKVTKDTINIVKPDRSTGGYAVVVPKNSNYEAIISSKNKEIIETPLSIGDSQPIAGVIIGSKSIPETNGKQDDIVVLTKTDMEKDVLESKFLNLNFDTNKWDIKQESLSELDRWAKFIKERAQGYLVSIEGHTDNVGTTIENQTLSENRAKAARDYLVSQGCSIDKITFKGFGESKELLPNTTDENKAFNRRVEIRLKKTK